MISYPYINDLFTKVLSKSKQIEGRFHMSYRYGAQEINSDKLGELIKEVATAPKYPLALLVPPHSTLTISEPQQEWERYRLIMFFVKTSFYDANGITNQNPSTRTSMHKVPHDWHDMKRCAVNFTRALSQLQRKTKPSYFRLPPNQMLFVPISKVGTDGTSGIRLDFDFDIFPGCSVEDYDEYADISTLQLDSHPAHK